MFSRIPFVSARQFKRTASPFDNPLLLCDDSERVASNKVHTIPFARANERIDVVFHAMLNSFNAIFFRDVAPFRRSSPAVCGKNIVWRMTGQAIRNRESIALDPSVLQKLVKELARLHGTHTEAPIPSLLDRKRGALWRDDETQEPKNPAHDLMRLVIAEAPGKRESEVGEPLRSSWRNIPIALNIALNDQRSKRVNAWLRQLTGYDS